MREIKFRGRCLGNGEWLYGSLLVSHFKDDKKERYFITQFSGNYTFEHEVDPVTVGQYTGLKDKNGREIYEEDILKSERNDRLYVVKFWVGMFYASVKECNKGIFGGFPLHALTEHEESGYGCDIIGNIHDNRHLLK